jgi:hypothetical protein
MASSLTLGRCLFFMSNLAYAGGAFLADWGVTHIYNPAWPPHAKFVSLVFSLFACLSYAPLSLASSSAY